MDVSYVFAEGFSYNPPTVLALRQLLWQTIHWVPSLLGEYENENGE